MSIFRLRILPPRPWGRRRLAPFALDRSKLRITVLGRNGAAETMGCPAG
ncbi:hypothetical protein [Mangrovicoccus ximenensis]|nr:hypothetical protein [Mangrovicoccus ximenensis]